MHKSIERNVAWKIEYFGWFANIQWKNNSLSSLLEWNLLSKYNYPYIIRLTFYRETVIIMGISHLFINALTTWGLNCGCRLFMQRLVEIGITLKGIHEHSCVLTYVMVSITLIAYVREKCEVWKTIFGGACLLLLQQGNDLMHAVLKLLL